MTSIEWTNQTWNPVTGCDPVSPGCAHCYAADVAKRFWGDRKFSDVQFHPDRLEQPRRWRKPRMVFVNSMSDLFHESVTDDQLFQILKVIRDTPQHTYQVLTKRPERMLDLMSVLSWRSGNPGARLLPNLWLGVTCESQRTADERIPLLLQTPAAVRFLSCEPLLSSLNLTNIHPSAGASFNALTGYRWDYGGTRPCPAPFSTPLTWVIVGGESGPKARPCNIAWIRSIVKQCKEAEVPVFVKQLGAFPVVQNLNDWDFDEMPNHSAWGTAFASCRLEFGKKGNDPEEWPEDLRVREFPPMPVNA